MKTDNFKSKLRLINVSDMVILPKFNIFHGRISETNEDI